MCITLTNTYLVCNHDLAGIIPCVLEDKSKCTPAAKTNCKRDFWIQYCPDCHRDGKLLWAEKFPNEVTQDVLKENGR